MVSLPNNLLKVAVKQIHQYHQMEEHQKIGINRTNILLILTIPMFSILRRMELSLDMQMEQGR